MLFRRIWNICQRGLASSLVLLAIGLSLTSSTATAADPGYESLFDGKTLTNWDGNPEFWRVEDGVITGETTPQKVTNGNTFLIYRGGEIGDFELKLDYKIVGGNSGVQYRSFEVPGQKWVIGGYQADFEAGKTFSGINYGEKFRDILALRGEETVIGANHKPTKIGSLGDTNDIQSVIKNEDWNTYHITASGYTFTHRINGRVTSIVHDADEEQRRATGLLALQLHAGPPMKVQFRNIQIKKTPLTVVAEKSGPRKIAFVAGTPSHAAGDHEHRAGCMLLADALNRSGLPVKAEVYHYGWPKDSTVLHDADTIVVYADGGGGHPFNAHLEELDGLMKKGVGMVCIHYGVEVPEGPSGNAFLDWTGGYFEANWSVNPHWTAFFQQLPNHPIANGVKPFRVNDEWYYHMRFRENMTGVTPILTDLPGPETLSRPDGFHSGNPHVRKAIANKERQHVAWAGERPEGGRGFGFTGGHNHWNWGNDDFRKLMLNAIVWTAKVNVPAGGVPSRSLTAADLLENLDEKPDRANLNEARVQAWMDEWNRQ